MSPRFADGIGSTRINITSIAACSLDTLFGVPAISVHRTEWYWSNLLSTFPIWSYECIIRTDTDNCFDGRTVFNFTCLRLMTGSVYCAWILAFGIDTCESTAAIVINPTFGLYRRFGSDTSDETISSGSWIASTFGLVVERPTGGIFSTGVVKTNGATLLAEEVTSLVQSTVIVCSTAHGDTSNQRISLKSR